MSDRFHIWVARLLFLGLGVFAAYYLYMFFSHSWPFAFSGSETWQKARGIDDNTHVGFSQRLLYFLMWVPTLVATVSMVLSGMWLMVLLLRGTYFEPVTVRALQWVGGSAAIAGLTNLAAMAFNPYVLTMSNVTEKVWPPKIVFDSGEIGVTLVGAGLFLLGLVLKVTVLMARENKEIV